MLLSVIIVNYNVKYYVEQCLNSVLASSIISDTEVIVLDNQSTDGSLEYLIPKFPTVQFIDNKANLGFSKANNIGIKTAKGKYILLLNPDTVIGEKTLENTCRFMDEHADTGALGVKMIDGTGRFLPESKRSFPTPWVSFCKIAGLNSLFSKTKLFGRYHLRYLDENLTHPVDVLAGAFMLLRREALDKVGLLDEDFFMYGEDIDLSYRMKNGGYNNYYFPEKILHYKGESTHANDFRYIRIFYGAMLIFYRKHFPLYSRFYSIFVKLGIVFSAMLALTGKVLLKIYKPVLKVFIKTNYIDFNTGMQSYRDIIEQMDKLHNKHTCFRIYNPLTGYVISSKCVEKKS